MSPAPGSTSDRDSGTLVFGGRDPLPDAEGPAAAPLPAPLVAPRDPRAAARRARQRRSAALRRSRTRMRAGSDKLLAFLLLLGLTVMLADLRSDGSIAAAPRTVAAAVLGPLQEGIASVAAGEAPDGELVAANEALRTDLRAAAGDRARLRELERLLAVASRTGSQFVAATVIARDPGPGTRSMATIDRGSGDGLAPGMAVVAAGGLIGIVDTVVASTAVVRLVNDPSFAVGGRLVGSGESGIARGAGPSGLLSMELLDPLAAADPGDQVVTYGSPGDGPFPPGLVIGTVDSAGEPGAAVRTLGLRPSADPTSAAVVAVVLPAERP